MYFLELLTSPATALVFLFAVIIAITVHEFAHAWTAYKLGDDTPYHQGRVTLNPLAHLDPFGSILFLLVGFGYGRPVQYNPMRLSRKIDELWVALAGPASNLLLALILNVLAAILPGIIPGLSAELFQFMALINVFLAAFNMLPIPPLDGSSIIAHFWPEYRSVMGSQIGFIVLLGLIFLPGPGGGRLLGSVVYPIIDAFASLTTLFGLL